MHTQPSQNASTLMAPLLVHGQLEASAQAVTFGRKAERGRPLRVALIDDEKHVRLAVGRVFAAERTGWDFESYAQAGPALERLPATRPDVVLMDLHLPDLSGVECLRELRSRVPGLPVVALTGSRDSGDVVEAVMAGACGYLVKPVRPAELLGAVRSAAEGLRVLCSEAGALLMDHPERRAALRAGGCLTPRECETMELLCQRLRDKEIAERLGVTPYAVHTNLVNIYRKLGVHSRSQAVRAFLDGI